MIARTRLEDILINIINGTLDTWLVGKNLFNESNWTLRTVEDGKECLLFNGYYTNNYAAKVGNPLLLAENLNSGIYTVTAKMKKTLHWNKLAVNYADDLSLNYIYTFPEDFAEGIISFTIDRPVKYLFVETGNALAMGYCEVGSLKLEIGSTATPYTPYAFTSELEEAYAETFGGE